MKQIFAANLIALCMIGSTQHSHGQSTAPKKIATTTNPFFTQSTLPYHVPPLNKIKDADYQPALEKGMAIQQQEIKKIAENPAAPTFENTLVAMEKSGQLLAMSNNVFRLVSAANTNPALQQLQEDMAPKLAANSDAIYLNSKLFARIEAIYNKRTQLNLDKESKRLVEFQYLNFVLAGAKLSEADKETTKRLNGEEALLSAKFGNQLVNAAKKGALVISDPAQLAGLSQGDMDALAEKAKSADLTGKWMIPLQNTTQQPLLSSLSNRSTRQALYDASWIRAEKGDSNDTRNVITQIASLRVQKAKLMGFRDYAEWKLKDQMAQTPEAVNTFLGKLQPYATAAVQRESADIQALIDKQNGGFKVQAWDWDYYSEQVRKAKYDLDESETRPYFELKKVLESGVFYAANQLYGLTFKERHDIPVYQSDVRVFEVFDKDQKSLALFFCDYYKRDNKQGGAWMDNIIGQSYLLNTKPVIYNICNFTKPAPGQPALISFDDVTTMFHEFGHALHGMFASQKYPSISGANTARDFVEFPSQFNEHWALDPKVLANYAVHYKTGEKIPQTLVDKIMKAATFNKGYSLSELVSASSLDMYWHMLTDTAAIADVDLFEKQTLRTIGMDMPQVPPRYRSTYFLHIWGNGYAAGYYAYQWTKMLEEDAFSWFQENGGMTRANGQRFRDMILSRGNTEDYNKMFLDFRGHVPDIKPMLKDLGMIPK